MKPIKLSVTCILFIQLILVRTVISQLKGKFKVVSTHLNAKWLNTPYLLETAEFLAEESAATFWAFVDKINSIDLEDYSKKSEKQKFDTAIETVGHYLTQNRINLLKFSLSLHVYSPRIEMFRQIADERGILLTGCKAVLEINSNIYCNLDAIKNIYDNGNSTVLDVDHIYPGSDTAKNIAILYGELGTLELRDFHNSLKELAEQSKIKYILRPFVKEPLPNKVRLSGYGVELQIKSTEYKAQDDTKLQDDSANVDNSQDDDQEIDGFIFSKLRTLHPDHAEDLNSLANHLRESSDDMAPLNVWQIQHLSMQAAQRIMTAPHEEILSTFIHISQNFPVLARSLARTKVNEKMKREIIKNQNNLRQVIDISPTDAVFFINGMQMDLNYIDMYSLLNIISDEQRVMEGLFAVGIKGETLTSLLKLDLTDSKMEYGIDIRDSAITWLNNIEEDSAYKRWPNSVNELLRSAFPGMMRSIRKNFHNLVIVIDPKNKESAEIFRLMESFVTHIAPIRFGVVLVVESDKKISALDDMGIAMLCAFNFIRQTSDGEDANLKGLHFLMDVYSASSSGSPSVDDVTKLFKSRFKNEDIDEVFGHDSDYDVGRQLSNIFIDKAGFRSFPQALMNGVPLPEKAINGDEIEETILMEIMTNTQRMQRAVFKGELDDTTDVVDWLMAQPNIMSRLNDRILHNKGSIFLDLSGSSNTLPSSYDKFKDLSSTEMTSSIGNSCHYITTKAEPSLRPLTIWVAADFESVAGQKLLLESVKYTRESNSVRYCFLNSAVEPKVFSKILQVAHNSLTAPIARQLLIKILDEKNFLQVIKGEKSFKEFKITGFKADAFESRLASINMDVFKSQKLFLSKVLGITPGKWTIIANGRILGLLSDSETFTEEDFSLLESYFMSSIGDKVVEHFKDYSTDDKSELIMRVSGILMSLVHKKPRIDVPIKGDSYSVLKLDAEDQTRPSFDLIVVCDPISVAAQQIGPIIQVLHSVLNANVKVVLNAREKHFEMPLKSFYRYVLQPEPQFTEEGEMTPGPFARFTGLPETTILTQSFHVPDNWLVEVVKSVHDLDNIKLELVESGVTSEFELEHLLLEGHCFEHATGNPPRGLQFTLGTKRKPLMFDTIVMANLGYFQLKGNPGNMILRLREGRSDDIYSIWSHEKHTQRRDEPAIRNVNNEIGVVIGSFRPHMIKIRVAKKPDMIEQDLLNDEDEDSTGIWGSITSTFTSSSKNKDDSGDDIINIFSVASGHLYERFIRIMMLSVRKHTTAKIKFWLIKNFLSPNLKDSLPVLAKEFDFEYELVQYKWPRWLHQQTEKQRVIWGYKILFLDVLFPLNVTKIIFVDADQVVRDDLRKLRDFDLDGAPYGFVPFCDSRREMEGFRFWKQGYWRTHLSGRRYHISALFVVDLKKFRRIAAGDRLRGQYQGLSADPNSLSNLDQDLPNNMVHQVRIKSLPMEWLWCETWCDDESKKQAKVIDLCNNPLTKEAKLDAANRIINEWSDYDVTIKKSLSSQINIENIPVIQDTHGSRHEEL